MLDELRGGSSCAELRWAGRNGFVCVGHWHNLFMMYFHFLYFIEAAPPYPLVAASHPFRFRRFFGDERDRTQFAAGAATDAARGTLRISLGVADCVATETELSLSDVAAMLRGDLVIPQL